MFGKLLFRIAKSPLMGTLVGTAFQYCSRIIPVKKLSSSRDVLAFYHPQPSYQNHIIITPKKAVRNLQQMASDPYCGCFATIWETVRSLQAAQPAFHDSFVLIANGGKRQEVQQVHFHMFANHSLIHEARIKGQAGKRIYHDEMVDVIEHPHPEWALHFVCLPEAAGMGVQKNPTVYFQKVLHIIHGLDSRFMIAEKGYSLIFQYDSENSKLDDPVFHIVSGKKTNIV